MIKVSVVVPVYNVEAYLAKCLDSLVNQTLQQMEIIVVNDGATDNSQKIIDEYAAKGYRYVGYIPTNIDVYGKMDNIDLIFELEL